jgi:hypothetical protein
MAVVERQDDRAWRRGRTVPETAGHELRKRDDAEVVFTEKIELLLEMFCGDGHRVGTGWAESMVDKDRDRYLRLAHLWS